MTKPNNSLPLVTVYMPTYNRVALLQRAVESVLSQDYRNIELIVVDDNSTDGTHQYLAEMAEKDSRFRYFINEKNSGACVSRNKAIFAANGEYITGLDDDDYFLHCHIGSLIKAWNIKETNCVALYPNTFFKTNKGVKKAPRRAYKCTSKDLLSANWIGNQLFTKTQYLQQIGGFNENMPAWQDLECWYRLLSHYNAVAYTTTIYSYLTDLSHPHERISTKQISTIFTAYENLVSNYTLNFTEREILQLQLVPYTGNRPPIKALALSLYNVPTKQNLHNCLLMLALPIFKTIKTFKAYK